AAKVAAPWALPVKGVGTRVNQKLLAPHRQSERQGVGVAVCRDRLISEGAGIGDQPDLVLGLEVAAEDVVAASGTRSPNRKLRSLVIELLTRPVRVLAK